MIVFVLRQVSQLAQQHHGADVDQGKGNRAGQVHGQVSFQEAPLQGEAPLIGQDGRHQQQHHQVAAEFPDRRFPIAYVMAATVQVDPGGPAVEDCLDQGGHDPESGFDNAAPWLVAGQQIGRRVGHGVGVAEKFGPLYHRLSQTPVKPSHSVPKLSSLPYRGPVFHPQPD